MTEIAAKAVANAVNRAGGAIAVASHFGIHRQSVYDWIAANRVPGERVCDLEALSGVSRYDLRPDIFKSPPTE